jgi:hypothetical protein
VGSDQWERAATLGATDVGADADSPDARASARALDGSMVSDPVAVENSTAVRVTVVSGTVGDVTVASVVSGDESAPSGSAGAWGGPLPGTPDRFGYAVALVLLGLALGAVALGWSPWRSRRTHVAMGIVAVVLLAACVPPPPEPDPTPPSGGLPSQPAIVTRAQWGAQAFSASSDCQPGPVIAPALKFAVVHHSVTPNTDSADFGKSRVRNIQAYHMDPNGLAYCDIAYNFLIDRYGQIYEGRAGGIDKAVVAAHAGGFNTGSTGVALLGTYTSEQPPTTQWDALVNLLAWKLSVHHIDPSRGFTTTAGDFSGSKFAAGSTVTMPNAIVGHRDVDFTECPGDAFSPRLGELRNAVQPKVGWGDPVTTTTTSAPSTATTTVTTAP